MLNIELLARVTLRPPSNPHRRAPKSGARESGRRRPHSILPVR